MFQEYLIPDIIQILEKWKKKNTLQDKLNTKKNAERKHKRKMCPDFPRSSEIQY